MAWYIGLMSGTSMDGVDAVLARCEPAAGAAPAPGRAPAWGAADPLPLSGAHLDTGVSRSF